MSRATHLYGMSDEEFVLWMVSRIEEVERIEIERDYDAANKMGAEIKIGDESALVSWTSDKNENLGWHTAETLCLDFDDANARLCEASS